MNNILLFIGGVLVIALGTAFAVPQFIDWNEYRGTFEDEASRVLGRPIRVGGKVDLRLLPSPYVRFEKLRIADSAGRFGLPFFKADSFKMHLSVGPLLQGNVEANQIELARPRLRLGVDENGNGNWRNFGPSAGSSLYLPADVALQSVKITDGLVAMLDPSGNELYRLDAINGIFSARSISGPYKFRGTAANGGIVRDINFATSRSAAEGSVPFKAIVKYAKTGARYVLDGRVRDISGRPKIEGDLAAKLPLKLARHGGEKGQGKAKPPKGASPPAAFDLKSKLNADAEGFKLSDLTLSFEQAGRPQLVSGEFSTKWTSGIETTASFRALWLDLDRIAGAGKSDGPVLSMGRFIGQLDAMLSDSGSSRASLKIDQANLGADTVSNIVIDLAKTDGVLNIKALRADLPGRARLEASGAVAGTGDARSFDGTFALHGSNLGQFAAWAGKGYALPQSHGGDYFGIKSHLRAGPGWFNAEDLNGELAQTVVAGALRYRWRGRKSLFVDLEGPRFDAGNLFPQGLRISGLIKQLLALGGGEAANKDTKTGGALSAVIKLRIGELIAASTTYHDVVADIALKDGVLSIPVLKLSAGDDLLVELSGEISGDLAAPKGSLRGQVKAKDAASVQALARLFDLPQGGSPTAARAAALAPLRLAGKIEFGRLARSADVTLAGTADGSRLNVVARLDGGLSAWHGAMTEIVAEAANDDARALITQVLPGAAGFPTAPPVPATGRLKLVGLPKDGLFTFANIAADGFATLFEGRLTIAAPGGAPAISGKLEIDASEAAPFLVVAGLNGGLAGRNTPVRGSVSVTGSKNHIQLGDIALNIAGSDVTGTATIVSDGSGSAGIAADLKASSASVLALLKPALKTTASGGAAGSAAASGGATSGGAVTTGAITDAQALTGNTAGAGAPGIWPDAPFSFTSFRGINGRLTLKTPKLTLDETLSLSDAVLEAQFKNERVVVQSLEGRLLGGRFKSALQLDRAPAGARAKGAISIDRAALEKLFDQPAGRPVAATGTASATLSFAGQALSPRGLMSVLKGSGIIKLGPSRLNRMSPIAIDNAADAVLARPPDEQLDALRGELRARLATGDMSLGPRQLKLVISDGALKVERFGIKTPDGAISALNTIDLAALKLDSEWRITPTAQRSKITGRMLSVLPPVTVSFVGPLGRLATLEPQIDALALARELTVRKMERDVEELERIRKLDEERAKAEAARQAALEAQRLEAERLDAERERARLEALQNPAGAVPPAPFGPGAPGAPAGQGPAPPAPAALQPKDPPKPKRVTAPRPEKAVKRPKKFNPFSDTFTTY